MDEPNKRSDSSNADTGSLEDSTTVIRPTVTAADNEGQTSSKPASSGDADTPPPKRSNPIKRLLDRFNIYLLLFILLLVLSGIAATVFYLREAAQTTSNAPSSQSLSQSTLSQLSGSDVTVGGPKNTLSVQSNAVFTGSVLMRGNLQIAGT